ncbi:hypothetical protein MSHOH_2258 [Methanosarcina horonobensis HB-1 = JCM 15518]|uniref:Uncharacterized protein n=1 Tax=Methanosarcina horonobensis HB-1 = JCM 15518 TaxID=1434110 RepID=A0A0E3SCX2_9EURY|nr:hypothetical protein [Methanosarcina horonobensis]AKB78741.1 hypothetical protein MSHOH_2258 [Methanosarcina horonobensis HB-1 = JCM 15518]
MNLKIFVLAVVILISLVGAAYTVNTQKSPQTSYNLTYNFEKGDKFNYKSVSSIEKPKNTISENIDILVSDVGKNHITIQAISTATINGNKTEDSYYINMTSHGSSMELSSKNSTIPIIHSELPNTLTYPEKEIKKDDTWITALDKFGNYTSDEGSTNYNLTYVTKYECLGLKTIYLDAKYFDCIGIKSDTNFTLNTATMALNKTIYVNTTGNTLGESWVDLKGGFLVKSEYDTKEIVKTDYSDLYEEIGLEKLYRETPINSHTTYELVNIKKE